MDKMLINYITISIFFAIERAVRMWIAFQNYREQDPLFIKICATIGAFLAGAIAWPYLLVKWIIEILGRED